MPEDTTPKVEETNLVDKPDDNTSFQWYPPTDPKLASYIENCKDKILTLQSKEEQIEELAR